MALYIPGPFTAEIRGSVGGAVFARNRAGPYARSRSVPVQPNTPLQQSQKVFLAQVSARWSGTLTIGQRTGWNNYANNTIRTNAVGEAFFWTGHQAYTALNTMRLAVGLAPQDNAPSTFGGGPGLSVAGSVTGMGTTLTITSITGTVGGGTGSFILRGAGPISAGVSFFKGPYSTILAIPLNLSTVFPIVVPLPNPVISPSGLEVAFKIGGGDGKVGPEVRKRFPGPVVP